jgi:septum site-determining protein MinC
MTKVLTDTRPIRLKGRSFLALVLSPELPLDGWLARLDDLAARSAGFFLGRWCWMSRTWRSTSTS